MQGSQRSLNEQTATSGGGEEVHFLSLINGRGKDREVEAVGLEWEVQGIRAGQGIRQQVLALTTVFYY